MVGGKFASLNFLDGNIKEGLKSTVQEVLQDVAGRRNNPESRTTSYISVIKAGHRRKKTKANPNQPKNTKKLIVLSRIVWRQIGRTGLMYQCRAIQEGMARGANDLDLCRSTQDLNHRRHQWSPSHRKFFCTQPMEWILQRPVQISAKDRH